jgi:FkbM family methyltransferase
MSRAGFLTKAGLQAVRLGVSVPQSALVQKYLDNVFFTDLLKRLRIDCLLDVGANTGQFASNVRATGYKGHIFSFEPIAKDADAIRARALHDERWHVYSVALGSEDGEKQFNVIGSDYTVLSSFFEPAIEDMPAERSKITVSINRLDTIFGEILSIAGANARISLKMDTQGFDLEVCEGCSQHMDRIVGLQSEVSVSRLYRDQPRYTDALNYYERRGFALMNLALVNRTAAGGILEYDALFARIDELAP